MAFSWSETFKSKLTHFECHTAKIKKINLTISIRKITAIFLFRFFCIHKCSFLTALLGWVVKVSVSCKSFCPPRLECTVLLNILHWYILFFADSSGSSGYWANCPNNVRILWPAPKFLVRKMPRTTGSEVSSGKDKLLLNELHSITSIVFLVILNISAATILGHFLISCQTLASLFFSKSQKISNFPKTSNFSEETQISFQCWKKSASWKIGRAIAIAQAVLAWSAGSLKHTQPVRWEKILSQCKRYDFSGWMHVMTLFDSNCQFSSSIVYCFNFFKILWFEFFFFLNNREENSVSRC